MCKRAIEIGLTLPRHTYCALTVVTRSESHGIFVRTQCVIYYDRVATWCQGISRGGVGLLVIVRRRRYVQCTLGQLSLTALLGRISRRNTPLSLIHAQWTLQGSQAFSMRVGRGGRTVRDVVQAHGKVGNWITPQSFGC